MLKVGTIVEVEDSELGTVLGRVTRFLPDGTPLAEFSDGSEVVLHADMFKVIDSKENQC